MASEKITAIIEELKTLTVLELSELVHAVEDEFGVSAAAAVVAAGPVAEAAAAEEKTEFDLELTEVGANKIAVIKVVREITGLAKLPSREILLANVLGAFQAPISAFARAIQAIVDKDGEAAPAEAEVAAEA